MVNIKTALRLLLDNPRLFVHSTVDELNMKGLLGWMSDKMFLKFYYKLHFGESLNLDNPQKFSEKLQWLKLYYRKPEYSKMVDKLSVKEYVADILGKEYIIPTLGVWDKPEDIEWDKLPNQFVLKTTHGGGNTGVVICRNKQLFDKHQAVVKLNESLKIDIYTLWREWPYKNVAKRIIAEEFVEPETNNNDLPDYKFFCFNGEPKYCQVISGRSTKMSIDFFDKDWNHQPFQEPKDYPFADIMPQKPLCIEKMWNAARELAEGKPFSRIDFYQVRGQVLFGEITFFPTSGFGGFAPSEYDIELGKLIVIPNKKV